MIFRDYNSVFKSYNHSGTYFIFIVLPACLTCKIAHRAQIYKINFTVIQIAICLQKI